MLQPELACSTQFSPVLALQNASFQVGYHSSFPFFLTVAGCRFIGLKLTLKHQEAFSCLNCNVHDVISLLYILEATCSLDTGRDGILGPSKQSDFREKRC